MTDKKKRKDVQMARPELSEGWYDGRKVIPFNEMTNHHLLNALVYAKRQELRYFTLCGKFSDLIEKLVEEAEKRKLKLKDEDDEFTRKTHSHKTS